MGKKRKVSGINAPANETKADRFVRVATPRVGKALKAIRVIGYCAGSTYEYTPNQVDDIKAALAKELTGLIESFEKKTPTQSDFSFDA